MIQQPKLLFCRHKRGRLDWSWSIAWAPQWCWFFAERLPKCGMIQIGPILFNYQKYRLYRRGASCG